MFSFYSLEYHMVIYKKISVRKTGAARLCDHRFTWFDALSYTLDLTTLISKSCFFSSFSVADNPLYLVKCNILLAIFQSSISIYV
jgi:hypothetical protein